MRLCIQLLCLVQLCLSPLAMADSKKLPPITNAEIVAFMSQYKTIGEMIGKLDVFLSDEEKHGIPRVLASAGVSLDDPLPKVWIQKGRITDGKFIAKIGVGKIQFRNKTFLMREAEPIDIGLERLLKSSSRMHGLMKWIVPTAYAAKRKSVRDLFAAAVSMSKSFYKDVKKVLKSDPRLKSDHYSEDQKFSIAASIILTMGELTCVPTADSNEKSKIGTKKGMKYGLHVKGAAFGTPLNVTHHIKKIEKLPAFAGIVPNTEECFYSSATQVGKVLIPKLLNILKKASFGVVRKTSKGPSPYSRRVNDPLNSKRPPGAKVSSGSK